MKKITFVSLFVAAQIAFIFLQIFKHSQYIQYSFSKQEHEQKKDELIKQKQKLTHQLYSLKKHSTIARYASRRLHMKKISLTQIKKLPVNE